MSQWLAIAAYRCEVAGEPTDSLDIQTRFFNLSTDILVEQALRSEAPATYLNDAGESVIWSLTQILAIEEFRDPQNGDELIGFIAQAPEVLKWVIPAT